MKELRFSNKANQDLEDHYHFICKDSFDAADRVRRMLYEAIDQLLIFPKLGKAGIKHGTRELVVGQYITTYQIEGNLIHILSIVHGARER